ncbi:NAD(P)-binding protein [Xylaria sp. FL1042]|nr:NAD(P)-binding protein [Xylaria sp. FL1042]
MSAFKRVAIAGSTGNLGPAILEKVIEAGFDVTVLTRPNTTHSFPQSVKVAEVDYGSLDSLTNVLRGQDVVISTIATAALNRQLLLVDAAAKAGVKRFLPSEFGSDTLHHRTSQLPCYVDKIAVQNALRSAAHISGMTYTFVINGPFFDWGMRVGFIADVKGRSVPFWDGGDRVFSTTTLATIGRAVVGVLKHPEETQNRAVYVQEAAVSSKQILEIGKRATGTDDWKAIHASLADHVKKGWEELEKPHPDMAKSDMNFITASIWGEEYGGKFENLDNKLLGIEEMDEEGIEKLIKQLTE